MAVPTQVSPWLGSGPYPQVNEASGCTGRHPGPRWPPTCWSGSGWPRSPAAAAPAGRWSAMGPPPLPSSRVSRGFRGGFRGVPTSSAGFCAPGSLLGLPVATPALSPRHTLPPCSPSAPQGLAQPGGLSRQDPQPAAPLCSPLQMASSPSSATTSRCAPSTRMPSGRPPTQQPTPGRRVRVLPASPLRAHLGSQI